MLAKTALTHVYCQCTEQSSIKSSIDKLGENNSRSNRGKNSKVYWLHRCINTKANEYNDQHTLIHLQRHLYGAKSMIDWTGQNALQKKD